MSRRKSKPLPPFIYVNGSHYQVMEGSTHDNMILQLMDGAPKGIFQVGTVARFLKVGQEVYVQGYVTEVHEKGHSVEINSQWFRNRKIYIP